MLRRATPAGNPGIAAMPISRWHILLPQRLILIKKENERRMYCLAPEGGDLIDSYSILCLDTGLEEVIGTHKMEMMTMLQFSAPLPIYLGDLNYQNQVAQVTLGD